MLFGRLAPFGIALLGCVAVGWLNTHTDELMVVIPFVILLSGAFGLAKPERAWVGAMLFGGALPASQLVALALGWHVPYPNDLSGVGTSTVAIVPAAAAAYAGAAVRRFVWDRFEVRESTGDR